MTTITMLSAVLERLQSWFAENSHSQLTTEGTQENLNSLWSWKDTLLQKDADAEKKYLQVEDFRNQVRQMMRILYGIENLVESYQVGVISRGNYNRRGCTKSKFEKISNFKANNKFQAELRGMTDQISGLLVSLKDSLERDGVGDLPSQQPGESSESPLNMPKFLTPMAMNHEFKLLWRLISESTNLGVISICGMSGIGKTTFARKLYNNPRVKKHFHIRLWFTVGMKFRRRDIFLSILDQVLSSPLPSSTSSRLDEIELASQVSKCLLRKRWLVVLDDMRSAEAWESIKPSFPESQLGERVLVTTRRMQVAESISGNGMIYTLNPLSEEDAWKQFDFLLMGIEFNSEQEQIARKISRLSGGVPLAVVLLADMLKANAPEEWNSVLQALGDSTQAPEKIVELCFDNLPPVLKSCLLYMATFPEESKFEKDILYQLWIAEGLVSQMQCRNGETMMNVTAQYFDNLEERSLVQITEEKRSDHQSFSCGKLHDLIRDFCITRARKEQYFDTLILGPANQLEDSGFRPANQPADSVFRPAHQPADSVFRRAIHFDKHDIRIFPHLNLELRTLLFFNSFHQSGEGLAIPYLSYLKWIKILHFDGVKFKGGKLPAGVASLVLLRYLSLKDCYLEELPSSISNFLFLQTLDLRVRKQSRMTLPNVLFKLERLRYLYLPLNFQTSDNEKLKLDGMKDLEILENFDTSMCNAGEICLLTSLRSLVVSADGNLKDLEHIFRCIEDNKNHLRKTSLDIRNFDCYSKERVSFIKKLLSCRVLHIFRLEGRIDVELGAISQSFTELHLNGSQLDHDPMQALKMLPNLRVLVLEVEAYTGKEMYCSKLGFPELRSLKLSKLYKLEALKVESWALPQLSTLEIENCRKLKKLPGELKFIHSLRTLKIGMMPKGFVGRLREVDGKGGQDIHKINPYCTIEFGNDDPWPEDSDSANQISSSTETGDLATSSGVAADQCERDVYLQ